MTFPRRRLDTEADPSQSLIANRPKSRLPEGYTPNSTLPPGYLPPTRDWQRTGALAREAEKPALSRRQVMLLAAGGLVLVLAIALVATLVIGSVFVQSSLNSPTTTIDTFYSDLRNGDDAQAYQQLSPAYRASLSQDAFVGQFQQLDLLNGTITNFTIQQQETSGSGGSAVVQVLRSANHNQAQVDTLTLTQSSGRWYIDHIVSRQTPVVTTPVSGS